MALIRGSDFDFEKHGINILISGLPGSGKSTLALSASNKALDLDFDNNGVYRLDARFRQDSLFEEVTPETTLEDIKKDIDGLDPKSFDTIIVDTFDKALEWIQPQVIAEKPGVYAQSDGSLSQKGYGELAKKWVAFYTYLKGFHKNLIIVAHAKEVSDDSITKLRIQGIGKSKDDIYNDLDLSGFLIFQGTKRRLSFENNEQWYAKSSHGITGTFDIPDVPVGQPNDFLAKLIDQYHANVAAEEKQYKSEKGTYDNAVKLVAEIDKAKTVKDINKLVDAVKNTKQALTSERELKTRINDKATALGFVWSKEANGYVNSASGSTSVAKE